MGNIVTLSEKFQISVPKEVREQQGWKAGQKIAFVADGKGVRLVRVPTLDELQGIATNADPTGYRDRDDRY
ncbi:MAG: AbrB/MazE/SpoVT family DNA-binding domain-containing protein [Alphaproteobacteria bacterium]|nr:AbrB/MazE/SpoVT family DNA-binding domain-containing protein [Alphaproteobacteria bacterium]